jgi:hypothetical protein
MQPLPTVLLSLQCIRVADVFSVYVPLTDHPGVLGVAFEANPGSTFRDVFKIPTGVAYVQNHDKDVFVLTPAQSHTTNYTANIAVMMQQLSDDPDVDPTQPQLHIVLAKYDTGLPFFGDPANSIDGALQYLLAHPAYSRGRDRGRIVI